jgi:hypothetical protein
MIQQGSYAIEGDLEAILFNHVDSTIPKWRTFKLLRWMQNLQQLKWDNEELKLVTMVTAPFLCDTLTHTCATMAPLLGPTV